MSILLLRRFFSFLVDYLLILLYVGILILIGWSIQTRLVSGDYILSPVKGQIIGFLTLTLPVFLYFFLSEAGSKRATIGKRMNKVQVNSFRKPGLTIRQVFTRNFLKLFPWEIAHTGVHWLVYYARTTTEAPAWVYVLLIFPQVIVLGYIVSIAASNGKISIYDRIAKTGIGFRVP